MIAYYFPPEGGAGSYRPLRFVGQLSKTGWRTAVITADPYSYERYDPGLLGSVPSETNVVRLRGRDLWQSIQSWRGQQTKTKISNGPVGIADQIRAAHYKPIRSRIRRAVRKAEAFYYYPDAAKHWIRPAVSATVQLCVRNRTDVIWASAGPMTAWIVARQASKKTGVPYVLDLRDPHGLSYYEPECKQPESVKRRIRRTMYQLFKDAQSVVFLFDTVAESYYRAFPGALDHAKIHVIPNGYDGETQEFVAPDESRFTILYTGTLASYRYDTLLQALVLLKRSDPTIKQSLRVLFVGECIDHLAKEAAHLDLCDIVETRPPISHAQINSLEQQSHAFLVLGRLPTIKGYELFAGAKIFSYLKARRPIFGVLPRDETRKILEGVGVCTLADVDSPDEIGRTLRKLLVAWTEKKLACLLPDRAQCEVYSAERQAKDLIAALEGAPASKSFVPGSVDIPPSLRSELLDTAVGVGFHL